MRSEKTAKTSVKKPKYLWFLAAPLFVGVAYLFGNLVFDFRGKEEKAEYIERVVPTLVAFNEAACAELPALPRSQVQIKEINPLLPYGIPSFEDMEKAYGYLKDHGMSFCFNNKVSAGVPDNSNVQVLAYYDFDKNVVHISPYLQDKDTAALTNFVAMNFEEAKLVGGSAVVQSQGDIITPKAQPSFFSITSMRLLGLPDYRLK